MNDFYEMSYRSLQVVLMYYCKRINCLITANLLWLTKCVERPI